MALFTQKVKKHVTSKGSIALRGWTSLRSAAAFGVKRAWRGVFLEHSSDLVWRLGSFLRISSEGLWR